MADERAATLRMIYQETCKTHNSIAGFRGTLLGLLPIASGAGILLLLGRLTGANRWLLLPIGVFGAAVTVGLFMYELRGIEDCTVLRGRLKSIEQELGVSVFSSQFGFWPGGKLNVVDEIGAAWIVYMTVLMTWLFVAGTGVASRTHVQVRWELVFGACLGVVYLAVLWFALASDQWGHEHWTKRRRSSRDEVELGKLGLSPSDRCLLEKNEIRRDTKGSQKTAPHDRRSAPG
jgi:hypothetical protein